MQQSRAGERGAGRHAVALMAAGPEVVGIDVSPGNGRIIASGLDPYTIENPEHTAYHGLEQESPTATRKSPNSGTRWPVRHGMVRLLTRVRLGTGRVTGRHAVAAVWGGARRSELLRSLGSSITRVRGCTPTAPNELDELEIAGEVSAPPES